jgi:hypothetical protein
MHTSNSSVNYLILLTNKNLKLILIKVLNNIFLEKKKSLKQWAKICPRLKEIKKIKSRKFKNSSPINCYNVISGRLNIKTTLMRNTVLIALVTHIRASW